MSFIRARLDWGLFVTGVFIDLRKAFDFVEHALFLSKMYKEGVRGDELKEVLRSDMPVCHIRNFCFAYYVCSAKVSSLDYTQHSTMHMFFSQLSYLNYIWNVAANGLINMLAVLQNRILKIIQCKPLRYPIHGSLV
jgi:hypothetical protein